jgi:hypothetical protein
MIFIDQSTDKQQQCWTIACSAQKKISAPLSASVNHSRDGPVYLTPTFNDLIAMAELFNQTPSHFGLVRPAGQNAPVLWIQPTRGSEFLHSGECIDQRVGSDDYEFNQIPHRCFVNSFRQTGYEIGCSGQVSGQFM